MKALSLQQIKHHAGRLASLLALGAALLLMPCESMARELQLKRLETTQVARLPEQARQEYEQALALMDKVLYERALTHFEAATEAAPDNAHLRLATAQLAKYLGDTRWGNDSIQFYDIAMTHLNQLTRSQRLNQREQGRADQERSQVAELQRSVVERDERRRQWGLEVAKIYMEDLLRAQGLLQQDQEEPEAGSLKIQRNRQRTQLMQLLEAAGYMKEKTPQPTRPQGEDRSELLRQATEEAGVNEGLEQQMPPEMSEPETIEGVPAEVPIEEGSEEALVPAQ